MSARDAWGDLFRRTFGAATRVLWLGDKRLAPPGALAVHELSELAPGEASFQGIGLVTRGELRVNLARVRPLLAPGGALLLVLDAPPLLGAVTRALRLAPKTDDAALLEACEALLRAGFDQPRVVRSLRPRLAISAQKPARLGPLDAFFEQPSP